MYIGLTPRGAPAWAAHSRVCNGQQDVGFTDGVYTKETRAHTQKELNRGGGWASERGLGGTMTPVLNARRRQKRQHLHRCRVRECQRWHHRPQ